MYMYKSISKEYSELLKHISEYNTEISCQATAYHRINKTLIFLTNEYKKGNYYYLHEIDHPYREPGLNGQVLFKKYGLIEKSHFENSNLPDTINNLIVELNDLFIQQKLGVSQNEIFLFFSENSPPPLDTGVFVYDDVFSGYIIVDTIPMFNNLKYYTYLSDKLGVERVKCKTRFIAYIDVFVDGSLRPFVYLKTGSIIDSLFIDIVNKIPKNQVTPAFYDGKKVNHRVRYSI